MKSYIEIDPNKVELEEYAFSKKDGVKVSGVYVWGYREPDRQFVPLYVGKAQNLFERMMQHYCRYQGGEYGVFDKSDLDAIYYAHQNDVKPKRIYEPRSFKEMVVFLRSKDPGHAVMVEHFIFRYLYLETEAERVIGEQYLYKIIKPERLLTFVNKWKVDPSADVKEMLDRMAKEP